MRGIANREINPEVNLFQTDNLINRLKRDKSVIHCTENRKNYETLTHSRINIFFYKVFSSFFQEKRGAGELTVLFPKGKR